MSRYTRITVDENPALQKITSFVKPKSKVLDCGCSSGNLGRYLIKNKQCTLLGIEIDHNDVKIARKDYKQVYQADLDLFDFASIKERFDFIIFADVLEHLKYPQKVLTSSLSCLLDNGKVILSVPNVAHKSIRLELLNGSFDYESLGILDNTHLHFFTKKTAFDLILKSGLFPHKVDYTTANKISKETVDKLLKKAGLKRKSDSKAVFCDEESNAYQYIFVCSKESEDSLRYDKKSQKPIKEEEDIITKYITLIKQQEASVKGLMDDNREKGSLIQKLVEDTQKKQDVIVELSGQIKKLLLMSEKYKKKALTLAERNRINRIKVSKRDENLGRKDEYIKKIEKDLRCLSEENLMVKRLVEELNNELSQQKRMVEEILSSNTWRLTGPLRRTSGIIRGITGITKDRIKESKQGIPFSLDCLENTCIKQLGEEKKGRTLNVGVSVVIPCYNGYDYLVALLPKLLAQKNILKMEVIIVDSESSDQTKALCKKLQVKVISIAKKEFSHSYSRNLGAENAKYEYLLFMVQDAMPVSDYWINDMLRAMKKLDVVALTPDEFPRLSSDLLSNVQQYFHFNRFMNSSAGDRVMMLPRKKDYETMRRNSQLNDVSCLIHKKVFFRYKYRNDYAEDLDLGLRLINDGYRLAFAPSIKVIHSHTRKPFYNMRRSFVDHSTLLNIFPDIPRTRPLLDNLAKEIFATINILREVATKLEMVTDTPVKTTKVKELVISGFKRGCNKDTVNQPDEKTLRYFDVETKRFLETLEPLFQIEGSQNYDGVLVQGMLDFLNYGFEFLISTYDHLDRHLLDEITVMLYKMYAIEIGRHLAFCIVPKSGRGPKVYSKIKKILGCGV